MRILCCCYSGQDVAHLHRWHFGVVYKQVPQGKTETAIDLTPWFLELHNTIALQCTGNTVNWSVLYPFLHTFSTCNFLLFFFSILFHLISQLVCHINYLTCGFPLSPSLLHPISAAAAATPLWLPALSCTWTISLSLMSFWISLSHSSLCDINILP